MTFLPRRIFIAGAGASIALAAGACAQAEAETDRAGRIDERVDAALDHLFREHPNARGLHADAAGVLVIPVVTKAGLGIGGSFGRGALRVRGDTVDYYSAASGSFGLQFGAKQYSHALFFMTEQALEGFRASPGWSGGADVEFVLDTAGENVSLDTTTAATPVVALIWAAAGLQAGATLKGTKYTRIAP